MIYDITPWALQKCGYKPVLNAIFVTKTDETITYVATDSFRLVEVTTNNPMYLGLRDGFYTLSQWKLIAKESQKKNPDYMTIDAIGRSEPFTLDEDFPEYKKLFPKETYPLDVEKTKMNYKLLIDLLELHQKVTNNKHKMIDLSKIKQTENELTISFDFGNGESEVKTIVMKMS